MSCPACGHSNAADALFCSRCGARLTRVCTQCEAPLPADAFFCSRCGSPVSAPAAAPVQPAPALPASFANGRYSVSRFLGEGGKKKVYRVHDTQLDRDVAFSLIKTDGLDEVGVERIRREARLMGRLGDHPHIVALYDLGDESGQPYLVSQLMAGGDVEGLIASAPEHRLPLADTLRIADQVCQALEYAHEHGIIHRDLKPGNVWLTKDGTAKLGDFGLAMAIDKTRLSIAGMIVGTVGYMPPEQALGRAPDARSDLYSLGAMLYEMTTGRPPFLGDDPVAIISQHVNTPPVAPSWHNPAVSKPLEALILRLLEKDPTRRPASATEVRTTLAEIARSAAPPTPTEQLQAQQQANPLDRLASGVFVGRERELETLRAAFDASLSGRGSIALLAGEPGIGKTALVDELATYARLRGAQVLWSQGYEWEGTPAYWSWTQLIRGYIHERDPSTLRSELGSGGSAIAQVISEVRERLPDLPAAPPLEGDGARYRLFDAIASFLRNASTHQPLVLVFDDLHWADTPSLALLQFVVRELRDARVLLVGTYRDVEVGRQHPLSKTLAELVREPRTLRLTLRGLSQSDLGRYIELTAGSLPPETVLETVHRATDGNAFFVAEVVRLLVSEGALERAGDGGLSVELPQGVREVVGRRLDQLSAECNVVLGVAAVVGQEFSLSLLERVTERSGDELLELLDEAVRARIIRETEKANTYRFSQELIQETLFAEQNVSLRRRLNGKIATALERLYTRELPAHYAELAHYYAYAGPDGAAKAVEYATLAGERSMGQYAWENAAKQFQQALTSLELLEEPDRRQECELLLRLGEAFNYMSTGSGDAPAAREAFYRAADIARGLGLSELLARAAIGARGHNPAIAFDGSKILDLLEETNASLGRGDSVLRCLVLSTLAGYLTTSAVSSTEATTDEVTLAFARSHQLRTEAVAMARRISDPQSLATALVTLLGWNLAESPQEVCREAREVIDLAASAGAVEIQFEGTRLLPFVLLQLADRDGADRARADLALLAQQYRPPVWEWDAASSEAMFALMDGRLSDAERLVRAAGQRAKTKTFTHFFQLFALGRFQGRFDPSLATRIDEILSWKINYDGQLHAALLALESGNVDAAREQFDALATHEFRDVLMDIAWLYTMVQCAEVAAWLGDRERSALLYDLLAPYADWCVAFSGASMYLGAAAFYLGLLATTLERWDEAERHFERAIELDTANRARPFVANARYHCADMLTRRDLPGDRERALALVDQALSAAEEIGYVSLAQRALALKVRVQGILKA